jgi:hypothetical protein
MVDKITLWKCHSQFISSAAHTLIKTVKFCLAKHRLVGLKLKLEMRIHEESWPGNFV